MMTNGNKAAKITANDGDFLMAYGIVGEAAVEGDMQVFGMKRYASEARARKAANAWLAA